MKRLLLSLLICFALVLPGQAQTKKPKQDGSFSFTKKKIAALFNSSTLRDDFTTALTAGNVNGTAAEPGPGVRTVRDVESKIAISGGWLNFGAQATAVYSEEDLVVTSPAITRTPGRLVICKWKCTTDGPQYPLALVTSTTPAWNHTNVEAGFWRSAATTLSVISNATAGPEVSAFVADGTEYLLAMALRATGAQFYIKGGIYTNWTKLYKSSTGATATLYLAAAGNTAVFALDFLKDPTLAWMDTPLLSTSGAMTWPTTNGLGHAETTGLGAGGSGLTMLDAGTWAADGTYVANTPVAGLEMIDDPGFNNAAKWTAGTGWDVGVTTPGVATKVAGSAAYLTNTALGTGAVIGKWYALTVTYVVNAGNPAAWIGGVVGPQKTSSGTYVDTIRATTTGGPRIFANSTFAGTADNFSVKPLPISQLITDCQLSTTDVLAEQIIHARTLGTQVGVALNLDRSFVAKCNGGKAAGTNDISLKEITGPAAVTTADTVTIAGVTYAITAVGALSGGVQTVTLASDCGVVAANAKVGLNWASWNGVLCYFDGAGNVKLDEVKDGAYTNRISAAVAFAADKRLTVRKIGTSVYVFYADALVGSTTAIDAAALAGKYVGAFSTLAANTITSLAFYDTGAVSNSNAILDIFSN